MRAILIILAARGRQQWRAWLLLTLLVAVGTGLVLGAVTAGRRADSAFPDFVAAHGYDALVYGEKPLPLASLPEVTQTVETLSPFYGQPGCSCGKRVDLTDVTVREVPPAALSQMFKLVSGRMPDQSDPGETLVSFTLQRDYGIGPGTLIRLPLAGAGQLPQILQGLNGGPQPRLTGPVITLRVTGIVAAENEFPAGPSPNYDFYPTAAFATATRNTPAFVSYNVRLRHGAADFARLEATLARGKNQAGVQDLDAVAAAVSASIHPQAVAWWVVAGLTAVTFLVATGQALSRQAAADDADGPVLAALGLRSGQFAALNLLRTLAITVTGVVAGVGVATLLSPLAPVGEARLASVRPGLIFDGPVAAAGAAAAVAAVLLLGAPPALRAARRQAGPRSAPVVRRSRIAAAAAAAGLPATVVLGIRHALDRGRGAAAAPVRAGLAGAVAAVTALCAIAVFGASLSHLLASPELYGDPFQAYIYTGAGAQPYAPVVRELQTDPAIDRITLLTQQAVTVGQVSVRALEAKPKLGAMLLSASAGRLPAGDGEIALGAATLRQTGAHVGGTVQVAVTDPYGKPRTARWKVVGTLPLPADFGTGGLGDGAVLTAHAYQTAQCPASLTAVRLRQCDAAAGARPVDAVLVHVVPGPAGAAALARVVRQNPEDVTMPGVPTALASFGESANFPLLVAVVVAVCGTAALAHLMTVSVARRRRESGLLKTLGLVRRQLTAMVFWQAVTVSAASIAAGLPLGLLLGRVIWRVFAANLGVVPYTVFPAGLLAAIAAGFLLVSLAIAVPPARKAAAAPTAQLLRAE